MAASSSVLVLAGLVAVGATAVEADRGPGVEVAADGSGPPPPGVPAPSAPSRPPGPLEGRPRAGAPALAADVAVPVGWRTLRTQDLVPVPAGRFPVVLGVADRAVVLVGTLDPQRVAGPGDLGPEARRLVGAFAAGVAPGSDRVGTVSDAADDVAGRSGWTSLRRVEGSDGSDEGDRVDGALVRVTTVPGPPGAGLVLLAVVRPSPTQVADARAADQAVRSAREAAAVRPAAARATPIRATPGATPGRPSPGPRPSTAAPAPRTPPEPTGR